MNPLKHSDVYKKFSNQILLPRPDTPHVALNFNSNESAKEEQGGTSISIERSTDGNNILNTTTEKTTAQTIQLQGDEITNNAVLNLFEGSLVNDSITKIAPKSYKKKHYHLFIDKERDFNKFNEIYDQDADTIIMK
ncbi:unnamed protein product [Leptosia nina]|uniref:Uncharacterized protein n=1 Tax=Leptosia nina TaxID=320188 RepID=A0AAV1IZG1_9NEOP